MQNSDQKTERINYDGIETCKALYREKREIIEYISRYGSKFEKSQVALIKHIALDKNEGHL